MNDIEQQFFDIQFKDARKSSQFLVICVSLGLIWGSFFYFLMNFKAFALLNFSDVTATSFAPWCC